MTVSRGIEIVEQPAGAMVDVAGRVDVADVAARARRAGRCVAAAPPEARRDALLRIADALAARATAILAANALDTADAGVAVAQGTMSTALLHRLALDPRKLDDMITGIRAVAALDDPVGRVLRHTLLDDGLELQQVTSPIGVVAAIFEARPDAMTQIAALALRAGNAAILKAGSEATRTARALASAMHTALHGDPHVPPEAIALVEGRDAVDVLLGLPEHIDLVVPRGSKALVRSIQARTRIPVLGHADGVCHVFIDASADPEMAIDIVVDAKVQYPAACNAVEVVLVHRDAASVVAPLVEGLLARGVTIAACDRIRSLAPQHPLDAATEADWHTEFGDLRLALRLVDSLPDAVTQVNEHGSHHTDAIVTSDPAAAAYFLAHVDSASVMHNASTRFADGFRYGLGAEVGISTGKLHARGPVGLDGLTSARWLLRGTGQVVATYSGESARPFRHEQLPGT
jgi:glutamate-5-semialdehyde dehydrogenase